MDARLQDRKMVAFMKCKDSQRMGEHPIRGLKGKYEMLAVQAGRKAARKILDGFIEGRRHFTKAPPILLTDLTVVIR